ncbi:MAG: hypothetical protein GKR94_14625 [Gammaproteobacteria bacterium]|nr:hypothetical protein [Gammaproteobacteria bacterium]
MLWSLAWGIADLSAQPAKNFLRDLHDYRAEVSAEQWSQAIAGLDTAIRTNPLSAHYKAERARLLEWRSWNGDIDSKRSLRWRAAAVAEFRRAIASRPTWGIAWAELAQCAALLDGLTAEVRAALERSVELAPWDRAVQRKILWIGLLTFNELDEKSRATVRGVARNILRLNQDVRLLEALSAQYGWDAELRVAKQALTLERRNLKTRRLGNVDHGADIDQEPEVDRRPAANHRPGQ